MTDKNTILAIVLSALVLIGWQYFFAAPQQKARLEQQQQQAQTQKPAQQPAGTPTTPAPAQNGAPGAQPGVPTGPGQQAAPATLTREAAIKQAPGRIAVETDSIKGSINLKGARIDDVSLSKFHETVNPSSPPIVLLSPSGSPDPFYAEFGWTGGTDTSLKLPTSDTVWKQEGSGALTVSHPVTLVYDNGQGLQFRRTISVDDKYLFTIKDEVVNKGANSVTLYPYGLISRHDTPKTLGYYLLHEGLIGYLGDDGLQEITYKKIEDKKVMTFNVTNAWFGITDKYWAATLLPDPKAHLKARFSTGKLGAKETYQTDYLLDAKTVAPGATASVEGRLFAGAKEVRVVNAYE